MGKPQVVTDQSFEQDVLKSDSPVLVDFWATWCGPCRMVAPVLEEVATEHGDKIRIAKLDVDANPITAGRFGVRAIPTMILFKNGREADRIVGFHPKPQLMQKLTPHLATAAPSAAAAPTASATTTPKATATPPTPPLGGSPTSSTPNAGVGVTKIH
ncbi:MAG: thioredoxin [Chloroflexi bacterium]|nr:MAG: thioredoxin [Chloroflexota bacterium]